MGRAWEKSGQIEFDNNGVVAPGALAYFFVGGTGTTPLTTYSDAAETTPRTHPVVSDANGRWPLVFIPYCTSYDVRAVTDGGTQLYFYQSIPNLDPVQAASDTVNTEQLLQTGDWLFSPKTGTRSGFVRANGRTIGSAASGATERANADCADLYAFFWNNFTDAIALVSTGRGATAAADFAANKTITIFDCRGGVPMGVADMGGADSGRFSVTTFTAGSSLVGGSAGGNNAHALTSPELAVHAHAFDALINQSGTATLTAGGTVLGAAARETSATANAGGGVAHNNVPQTILGTWYIKL